MFRKLNQFGYYKNSKTMCLLFLLISKLFNKKKESRPKVETTQSKNNIIKNGDWTHRICWMDPPNDVSTSSDIATDRRKGHQRKRYI